MRNGNPSTKGFTEAVKEGSYRTYEEWKLIMLLAPFTLTFSSYRTYEEWKPLSSFSTSISTFGFLPYLWGMETRISTYWTAILHCSYRTYEEWKLDTVVRVFLAQLVLTVPMRNGNELPRYQPMNRKSKFLPYLWGMETTTYCMVYKRNA